MNLISILKYLLVPIVTLFIAACGSDDATGAPPDSITPTAATTPTPTATPTYTPTPTATPTYTPTPVPDYSTIVDDAIQSMKSLDSYHAKATMTITLEAVGLALEMPFNITQDYESPSKTRLNMDASFLGEELCMEQISIGTTMYAKDCHNSSWDQSVVHFDSGQMFAWIWGSGHYGDPPGWEIIKGSLHDSNGISTYTIDLKNTGTSNSILKVLDIIDHDFRVESSETTMIIAQESTHIVQFTQTMESPEAELIFGPDLAGASFQLSLSIQFSRFNEEVSPPILPIDEGTTTGSVNSVPPAAPTAPPAAPTANPLPTATPTSDAATSHAPETTKTYENGYPGFSYEIPLDWQKSSDRSVDFGPGIGSGITFVLKDPDDHTMFVRVVIADSYCREQDLVTLVDHYMTYLAGSFEAKQDSWSNDPFPHYKTIGIIPASEGKPPKVVMKNIAFLDGMFMIHTYVTDAEDSPEYRERLRLLNEISGSFEVTNTSITYPSSGVDWSLSRDLPSDSLLVTSANTHEVLGYDLEGNYLGVFARPYNTQRRELLAGLGIGPNGNIYVTSHGHENVLEFDAGSYDTECGMKFVGEFAETGGTHPEALAFDSQTENMYVAYSDSIGIYDSKNGEYRVDTSITGNSVPQKFDASHPWSITLDSAGNVFYNGNDAIIYKNGSPFISHVTLTRPAGIAFSNSGVLYVSNPPTNEILKFNGASGEFIEVFAKGGPIERPLQLAFDAAGDLYIASFDNDSVLVYDGISREFKSVFTSAGPLAGPIGLLFYP